MHRQAAFFFPCITAAVDWLRNHDKLLAFLLSVEWNQSCFICFSSSAPLNCSTPKSSFKSFWIDDTYLKTVQPLALRFIPNICPMDDSRHSCYCRHTLKLLFIRCFWTLDIYYYMEEFKSSNFNLTPLYTNILNIYYSTMDAYSFIIDKEI